MLGLRFSCISFLFLKKIISTSGFLFYLFYCLPAIHLRKCKLWFFFLFFFKLTKGSQNWDVLFAYACCCWCHQVYSGYFPSQGKCFMLVLLCIFLMSYVSSILWFSFVCIPILKIWLEETQNTKPVDDEDADAKAQVICSLNNREECMACGSWDL